MLAPSTENEDVEVRREDQNHINEFGRLNSRKIEIAEELEEAKKAKEELDDGEENVLLASDEPGTIKMMIGESFFNVDSDHANEFITEQRQKNEALIELLGAELAAIDSRQGELKVVLYGRFGKSINLEES